MQRTVSLTPEHQDLMAEILTQITEYKSQALSSRAWTAYEVYLTRAVEQLKSNQWICNRADNNTFHWIVDQIHHSRRCSPGVRHSAGTPLDQTRFGARVITICETAARGQGIYDMTYARDQANPLFVIEENRT